ncbi:MAG: phosphoenolpyruvate--protein phosphotransferase [Veillonella caviae]|nr:phosphoenolpyruvate--protein phosphotransferase [Veillonella caviae]
MTQEKLTGISGARGVGAGVVYVYKQEAIVVPNTTIEESEVEREVAALEAAVETTVQQLESIKERARTAMGDAEAAIFEAHTLIVQDPSLSDGIKSLITSGHVSAAAATEQQINTFADMFLAMDDPYMRERGADIKDIGDRLLRNLLGMSPRDLAHLTGEVILVADDLTPSDTASLDKTVVQGIVTSSGGPTSHAAIMARTLEIPAVMGVGPIDSLVNGTKAVVRGTEGEVLLAPSEEDFARYAEEAKAYRAHLQELKQSADLPSVTKDGKEILLFGNVGKAEDASHACHLGAEGIGLFRTEFLYMKNDALPTEDEQFEVYKKVAERLHGNPVIIRTMDIGGDKELKCLQLPNELNPFLGYRAIRISLDRTDIFKTQLRAILRASAFGGVQIMYPMIASIEEVKAANAVLEEAKAELRAEGIAFNEDLEVGIMVEIPSVAVAADLFASHVDFFSIGTNDLCQYTLAVDRMNEKIGHLYQPLHPAVLRLIKNTIDASHKVNHITGMCGEMAGDPLATMILIGLGLDEFSMSASSIPVIKDIMRSVTVEECKLMAEKALQMSTAKEISDYARATLEEKGITL